MPFVEVARDSWVSIDTRGGHRYEGILLESTVERIVLDSGDSIVYLRPEAVDALTVVRGERHET